MHIQPAQLASAAASSKIVLFACCLQVKMASKRGRGGASGNKFRMSLGLPVAAVMNCADNSGAQPISTPVLAARGGLALAMSAASLLCQQQACSSARLAATGSHHSSMHPAAALVQSHLQPATYTLHKAGSSPAQPYGTVLPITRAVCCTAEGQLPAAAVCPLACHPFSYLSITCCSQAGHLKLLLPKIACRCQKPVHHLSGRLWGSPQQAASWCPGGHGHGHRQEGKA